MELIGRGVGGVQRMCLAARRQALFVELQGEIVLLRMIGVAIIVLGIIVFRLSHSSSPGKR